MEPHDPFHASYSACCRPTPSVMRSGQGPKAQPSRRTIGRDWGVGWRGLLDPERLLDRRTGRNQPRLDLACGARTVPAHPLSEGGGRDAVNPGGQRRSCSTLAISRDFLPKCWSLVACGATWNPSCGGIWNEKPWCSPAPGRWARPPWPGS